MRLHLLFLMSENRDFLSCVYQKLFKKDSPVFFKMSIKIQPAHHNETDFIENLLLRYWLKYDQIA